MYLNLQFNMIYIHNIIYENKFSKNNEKNTKFIKFKIL